MKRIVCILLALSFFLPGTALAAPLEETVPFDAQAASLLLMEAESGQVIFERDADTERPVASVTKLMTILLLLEMLEEGKLQPDEQVTVSSEAAGMGGSQALLDSGGVYPLETLLRSLVIASANDSAVALAEHSMGSQDSFVESMNRRAAQLGLAHTVYKNTTGLPVEGQHTTARDVAVLSQEVLKHERFFEYSTVWMEDLTHNSGRVTSLVNTNRLIRFYEGADGVKTGSTNEAGFCVSASAKRGDLRFIAVVLGAKTGKQRFAIASSMLDHGFDHYAYASLAGTDEPALTAIPVENAGDAKVDLYLAKPVRRLVRRGEEGRYTLEYEAPDSLRAPIEKGQPLGSARLLLDGQETERFDLVAGAGVSPSGYLVNLLKILQLWPVSA